MARSPKKFAQLLTKAIYKIRLHESQSTKKTLRIVQDELGYELGRDGGSAIEYWRKGYIPAKLDTLEALARALVKRQGLDQQGLKDFLISAGYPDPIDLGEELFPPPAEEQFAPFVVGPPITYPRQFFGREQELRRIFALWKRFPLQNIAIVGLQRSGKTSLLRYVEKISTTPAEQLRPGQRNDWLPQPERYRSVFVDFQNAQMCNRSRLLRYLLTSLGMPLPDPCDLNSFIEVIHHHLRTPTIIMMDEIGVGLASPELDQQFWWSLRSLGSNYTDGKLGFLLAAHETPALLAAEYGKPSPFFNIFGHTIALGPLDEAAARALIASSPKSFNPTDSDWILTQSGRWPALLQILCDTRLMAMEMGQADETWRAEALRRIEPFRYLLDR